MDFANQLNLVPGSIFGSYRILAELAEGGQGLVLRAQHTEGTIVALKILLRAEGPAFKRFQQEVAVLARLFHPNLPRILDSGLVEGRPFLAMQLVEGGSLSDRLKHQGPLPVEEAIEILEQIAQALEYCHSLGVYHRDLKPANIVVDESTGRPFLVDFGILKHDASDGALSLDGASRMSMTGEVVGTIAYMAPEQGGDSEVPVGPATDVYGLAATLFDLLTGRPPFKGETAYNTLLAVIDQPPPDLRSIRPEIPAGVAEVCLRALAKYPEGRPSSPLALMTELRAGLQAPAPAPAPAGGGSKGLLAALVLVLSLLLLTLGWGLAGLVDRPAPSPTSEQSPAETPTPTSRSRETQPSAEPPTRVRATPRPKRVFPVGLPGSLSHRDESSIQLRDLVRCGPWVLARDQDLTLGIREDAPEEGQVTLPAGAWPFGWDAVAGALVYEQEGQSFRVTPTGPRPSPYPTGFGLVELGKLRVATASSGRLIAFDRDSPSQTAWAVEIGPTRSLPLPLDLDLDGQPDHLLACTLGARAFLIDTEGQVRAEVVLPGGVEHTPLLIEFREAPIVIVATSGGLLLRCEVGADGLSELSRLDLMEPLRGPLVAIRKGERVGALVATVQTVGLALMRPALESVSWVSRRATGNELCLSGPAVVDLDRDGTPEVAIARFNRGSWTQAWVEVYRLDGHWVTRLPAGDTDLRLPAGNARRLFAAGEKGVFVWGPWESLPEPSGAPPFDERLYSNLLGGAWKAVQEDAARIKDARGHVFSAFVARHLGQPPEGELKQEDMKFALDPILSIYGERIPQRVGHRLFGPPDVARARPATWQEFRPESAKPEGKRKGLEFKKGGVIARGVGDVRLASFDPERRLFGAGGRIRFDWASFSEGPVRLILNQNVLDVRGTGFAELSVSLDGVETGVLSCYYGREGELVFPLGELAAGQHRVEIEIRRTTAQMRIGSVWVEPNN